MWDSNPRGVTPSGYTRRLNLSANPSSTYSSYLFHEVINYHDDDDDDDVYFCITSLYPMLLL